MEDQPSGMSEVVITDEVGILQELQNVGKIYFSSMTLTKTVTTDRTEWYKVGKRVGVYSYDVYLKGYVDLSELTDDRISIDRQRGVVRVDMPEIKTEITGRSPDLRVEYENIGIFRSHPDSRERAELKEIANEEFKKEMKNNPEYLRKLKETAELKGRLYIASLINAAGYKAVIDGAEINGAAFQREQAVREGEWGKDSAWKKEDYIIRRM